MQKILAHRAQQLPAASPETNAAINEFGAALKILKIPTGKNSQEEETNIYVAKLGEVRLGSKSCWIDLVVINMGIHPPRAHKNASEVITIKHGKGSIIIGSTLREYTAGSTFEVPAGVPHGFNVTESTVALCQLSEPICGDDLSVDVEFTNKKQLELKT